VSKLWEAIHGVLFLAFIAACYLFVFAGIAAIIWVAFAALVRAALP
jgi:hypothetical protein